MTVRSLLALLALTTAATITEAGPLRRRSQPTPQNRSYQPAPAAPAAPAAHTSYYSPVSSTTDPDAASIAAPIAASAAGGDGLDEVNAQRAARGLRPFIRDEALTQGAYACAAARAARGQFGHTANDFAFLPPGASARSAGCAAYPASYGWMSCCVYDNATYAGAAAVTGADGKRYMQLFVR